MVQDLSIDGIFQRCFQRTRDSHFRTELIVLNARINVKPNSDDR
jgi:hypothetical protein